MAEPMSLRAYARSRGLNVSTISRQVRRGKIPTDASGLIDPEAADDARRRNLSSARGGKRVKRPAHAPAPTNEAAIDPEVRAVLAVIRTRWPALMQRLILQIGGDAQAAAFAIFSLKELTEYTALGAAGPTQDVPDVLDPPPVLAWPAAQLGLLDRLENGEPTYWDETPAGAQLVSDMIDQTNMDPAEGQR
jgi:hypothetical protein